MQKVVTIYLDSHVYMDGKRFKGTFADKHGLVEEHLVQYLDEGWVVKEIFGFGGAEANAARGWILVVLEKL
jgi:hypothetical protein